MSLTRRDFLGTGAGLVIAFAVAPRGRAAKMAAKAKPAADPNAFLRIAPDDAVTVVLAHSEMGQGIWTGLAMLIAEELECDWSKVRCEHAPAAQTYAHTGFGTMATGGSSSTNSEFERYRKVGACAREMLIGAAAKQWKVSPKKLRAENGFVIHGSRKLSYGQLAEAARSIAPPDDPKLKDRKDWKLLGTKVKRLDSPEKINGKAIFGMDTQFEGLRTAVVARAPSFGGKVKSLDASAAKAIKGVEQVVQVPTGVAVIATNYWAAKVGRDALKIEWDLGPGGSEDTQAMWQSYRELSKTPGLPAKQAGDADAALAKAVKKVEAVYEAPYLAHAPMEPLNATVKIDDSGCEIWTGTQFQQIDQGAAAKICGLPPEKVKVHTPFLGGGFGRRGSPRADFVSEAVAVAKAAGVPVKTVWSREDDIRGGYYRPAFLHRISVGVGADGKPVAWKHTIVGQSIMAGTMFEPMMVKNGIDPTSTEGAADSPYLESIADKHVSLHTPKESKVPVHFWRSVGHTHTSFAMESMIDELAHAAGADPLAYRLELLKDKPRVANVLKAAAELGNWGSPPPQGHARGLAVQECFGSIGAHCVEVSVDADKTIHVHSVAAALDCGTAVNPFGIEAQVQSAVAYGLGAALHSEITLAKGQVVQSNFHDYQVLRLPEMPKVSVKIIESGEKMGGIGEPGTPAIFASVANAVFAITGQRLRTLPLRLA
jgi:isoquinoline 1-oxidoreductase beta subunit